MALLCEAARKCGAQQVRRRRRWTCRQHIRAAVGMMRQHQSADTAATRSVFLAVSTAATKPAHNAPHRTAQYTAYSTTQHTAHSTAQHRPSTTKGGQPLTRGCAGQLGSVLAPAALHPGKGEGAVEGRAMLTHQRQSHILGLLLQTQRGREGRSGSGAQSSLRRACSRQG